MALNKLNLFVVLVVSIYIASPIVFKYSPFIQRNLLFMNYVNIQYGVNLSHPELVGIKCSRTLRLTNDIDNSEGPVELGVWHIVPESALTSCVTDHKKNRTGIDDKLAFADDRPIILYVHGNGGTRAGDHRSILYRKLAYTFDYHVITFDYRGYGDSTNLVPTVDGVTADARFIFDWLSRQPNVHRGRLSVWGHSLGTAIATRMVAALPSDKKPKHLILEAPFDSVGEAIRNHPFSAPFRVIPYFDYFFINPMVESSELNFDSTKSIGSVKPTYVTILHAEDDAILPVKLGRDLYKTASEKLGASNVQLIEISADHGLGHKHICKHDDTMNQVRHIIDN